MKKVYKLFITITYLMLLCSICSCNDFETNEQNFSESTTNSLNTDNTVVEATSVLAGYVKIQAGLYEWKNDTPSKVYGVINASDDFSKILLKEYPQLENMEYIIIFENNNPKNVFIHQPDDSKESIGASGNIKHIEDINVRTWEELLSYYNIHK